MLKTADSKLGVMSTQERANSVCERVTVETDTFYNEQVVPTLTTLAKVTGVRDLGPAGYAVLFGPPIVTAEILFIGFQPGGGPELSAQQQPAHKNPMWPSLCEYANVAENYNLARDIRSIFSVEFLSQCTGSEVIFFRAKGDEIYGQWPVALRKSAMEFCTVRLLEMVDAIAPKRIVFIGKRAMSALMPISEPALQRDTSHFLLSRGNCRGIPAVGCRHLTGGRLRATERMQITAFLREFARSN